MRTSLLQQVQYQDADNKTYRYEKSRRNVNITIPCVVNFYLPHNELRTNVPYI